MSELRALDRVLSAHSSGSERVAERPLASSPQASGSRPPLPTPPSPPVRGRATDSGSTTAASRLQPVRASPTSATSAISGSLAYSPGTSERVAPAPTPPPTNEPDQREQQAHDRELLIVAQSSWQTANEQVQALEQELAATAPRTNEAERRVQELEGMALDVEKLQEDYGVVR